MIAKSNIGSSISGAVEYITTEKESRDSRLDEKEAKRRGLDGERVAAVDTQNLFHERTEKAAREMETTASMRERLQKNAYHLMVNYHRAEEVTDEDIIGDAKEVLRRRGLGEHQAIMAVHRDRQHPHVHVVVNRVHPTGDHTWNPDHDYFRNMKVLRQIERERGRISPRQARQRREEKGTPPPRLPSWKQKKFKAEILKSGRSEAEVPFALAVRERAGEAFGESETWRELQRRLARRGLQIQRREGGAVVTDGQGREAQLSSVSQGWSYPSLDDRFPDQFQTLEQIQQTQNQTHKHHEQSDGGRSEHGRGGGREGKASAGARKEGRKSSREGGGRPERDANSAGNRSVEGGHRGNHVGGRGKIPDPQGRLAQGDQHGRGDAQQNPGETERGGPAEGSRSDQATEKEDRTLPVGGGQNGAAGEPPESGNGESQSRIEAPDQENERPRESYEKRGESNRAERVGTQEPPVDSARKCRDRGSHGSANADGPDLDRDTGDPTGDADDGGRDPAGEAREIPGPTGTADDRNRVESVPESLEEGGGSKAETRPGLTEVNRLTGEELAVWDHLANGQKEPAARAFDELEASRQEKMAGKLDIYDRQDLREGYEQAIERDEIFGESREGPEQPESQPRSRNRGRGEISQ